MLKSLISVLCRPKNVSWLTLILDIRWLIRDISRFSVANSFFDSCQRPKQILATECFSCRAARSMTRGEGHRRGNPPSFGGWGLGGLPLENFGRMDPKWCNFTYFWGNTWFPLASTWIHLSSKGAIIFNREGGPSVYDGRSPIFSGPPLRIPKKHLVPPLD